MYNIGVNSKGFVILSVLCLFLLPPVIISVKGNQDDDNREKLTQDNINLRGREELVLKNSLKNSDEVVTVDIHAPPVVEVALVCSKEFSDKFGHNRHRMLDFFSAYFWDVSLQFRTLRSSRIYFTITSLTLISSKEKQAFIENARDPIFGNISITDIMEPFQTWIAQKIVELPRFNVAILVTEPTLGAVLGAATLGGCCQYSTHPLGNPYNGLVLLDGTLHAGAHEIAHLLGAPHDDEADCKDSAALPLTSIMQHTVDPLVHSHFFSLCSDDHIREFLKSPNQKCLKVTPAETPLIDPDFDSVLPPTIQEQCHILSGDRNAIALARIDDNECALRLCFYNHNWSDISTFKFLTMVPLSNSKCENVGGGSGRCFQGRCISPGSLLQNVGTKMCFLRPDMISKLRLGNDIGMEDCPRSSTPFEQFDIIDVIKSGNDTAKMLRIPCQIISYDDGNSSQSQCIDKCLLAQSSFGGIPMLGVCNETDDLQKWNFIDINSNDEFFLHNVGSNTFASSKITANESTGNLFPILVPTVRLSAELNESDRDFRWKLNLVMPEPGMCKNEDNCVAHLQPEISMKSNSSTNLVFVNISLINSEGVAISPAALISWKSNITLVRMPNNCILFPPGLKCKVGKLLKAGETFLVAKLEFDTTNTKVSTKLDLPEQLKINVTATMAKAMDIGLNRDDDIKEQNSEYFTDFIETIFILMFFFMLLLIIPTIIQRCLHSKICRLLKLEF